MKITPHATHPPLVTRPPATKAPKKIAIPGFTQA